MGHRVDLLVCTARALRAVWPGHGDIPEPTQGVGTLEDTMPQTEVDNPRSDHRRDLGPSDAVLEQASLNLKERQPRWAVSEPRPRGDAGRGRGERGGNGLAYSHTSVQLMQEAGRDSECDCVIWE